MAQNRAPEPEGKAPRAKDEKVFHPWPVVLCRQVRKIMVGKEMEQEVRGQSAQKKEILPSLCCVPTVQPL
jgi:hypothetical protein